MNLVRASIRRLIYWAAPELRPVHIEQTISDDSYAERLRIATKRPMPPVQP